MLKLQQRNENSKFFPAEFAKLPRTMRYPVLDAFVERKLL
jgi:hypothetical protein